MAWVRLADDFADHPKLVAVGPLAGWLWLCGIAYCNRYLTDGFIPGGAVRRLADVDDVASLAVRLVDVGLWETIKGGYRVHDYDEYQPSAEAVRVERKRNADRAAKWRGHLSNAGSNAGSTGGSNGVSNTPCNAGPVPGPGPGPVPGSDPAGTPPNPPPAGGAPLARRSTRTAKTSESTAEPAEPLTPMLTPEEVAEWQSRI